MLRLCLSLSWSLNSLSDRFPETLQGPGQEVTVEKLDLTRAIQWPKLSIWMSMDFLLNWLNESEWHCNHFSHAAVHCILSSPCRRSVMTKCDWIFHALTWSARSACNSYLSAHAISSPALPSFWTTETDVSSLNGRQVSTVPSIRPSLPLPLAILVHLNDVPQIVSWARAWLKLKWRLNLKNYKKNT